MTEKAIKRSAKLCPEEEEFARLEADEVNARARERYHALARTLAEAPPDD